ncbi:hypothetical protein GTP43_18000 [Vibrio cholerae]|uniref:hypothetical protein n=1 Tax=Vibrio TaxID=662 RepID=UPI000E0A7C34|nr:hypothetical protein [Vibrio cholerae]EGQ8412171.1 hypothetical protein [Vibrio cholerae]EGR2041074.1 hypothetical protein [Vibrio cholerae]EGR2064890.1 hypothetical protein [Vibrio cholerae]EGR2116086.1 hypothetical protein [Vibrio cholerae]EGR2244941.1 hypothetical protein [Vibrio cholerae]
MKKILSYFTNPESQTVAVWIQTLLLGFGLYYAIIQIDFISQNQQIEMNERYVSYHVKYRDDISRKVDDVYDFYSNIKTEEQAKTVTAEMLKANREIEQKIFKYFQDLSTCADFGLCPSTKAKELICYDAYILERTAAKARLLFPEEDKRMNRLNKNVGYYGYWKRSQCSLITQIQYFIDLEL